jgi:hypothetical protein
MSVHTFFTGVRGVIAPLVAFHLASGLSLGFLAGASTVLILVSALLLVPKIGEGARLRAGRPLVKEISD